MQCTVHAQNSVHCSSGQRNHMLYVRCDFDLLTMVVTSQACAAHPACPIVILRFSCLSVCPSVQGLGRPGNEFMAAAGTYGCFELAGCSPPRCKRKQNNGSTIDARGTALVTRAQYRESNSRSTGMARNQRLTTNIVMVLQYCVP